MSSAMRKENIYIFIDNSNLWIQGQRTYAKRAGMSVMSDPTWRFDAGRLKTILIENSGFRDEENTPNEEVYLYGSIPPPVDTVWDKIKSQKIEVQVFQRSSITNREKLVDSTIVAESVERACIAQAQGTSGTFVLVSGDADMLAAVRVIAGKGFDVHVWSWKNALSSVYSTERQSVAKVHELDKYLDVIGFSETKFNLKRSLIDPNSMVVLDPLLKASEINQFVKSLSIPVYRYEMTRPSSSTEDLVIIPVTKMEHKEATELLQTAQAALKKHGLRVMNYLEYSQQHLSRSAEVQVHLSSQFSEMPGFEVQGSEEEVRGKDTDTSFTLVDQNSMAERARLRMDGNSATNVTGGSTA